MLKTLLLGAMMILAPFNHLNQEAVVQERTPLRAETVTGTKVNLLDESTFVVSQKVYLQNIMFETETSYTFATKFTGMGGITNRLLIGSNKSVQTGDIFSGRLTESPDGWFYATFMIDEAKMAQFIQMVSTLNVTEEFQSMLYEGSDVPEDEFYSIFDEDGSLTGPIISGSTGTYYGNVDNPIDVDYLKSLLIAWDETDGDLTDQIQIKKDELTGNESTVGEYEVTFSVSDEAGNESTFTITVYMQDKTKPVINGPSELEYSYTNPQELDAIKALYTVTDNVDEGLTLEVSSDTYTANADTPGAYRIIFKATDLSQNEVTKTVDITVIDDVAPVISGADKVEKSLTSILTVDEIIAEYTATDAIDGECEISVTNDTFTGHGDKVGTYSITLEATDLSGNKATKVVQVVVFDDVKPIWYIKGENNIIINVDETLKLNETDIKRVLAREDYYTPGETTVFKMTDVDGYFANGEELVEPGEYDIVYNIKKQNGESEDVAVTLKVLSVEDQDVETPDKEEVKSWFEKNFDFEKQTWGAIVVEGLAAIILIAIIATIIKRKRY